MVTASLFVNWLMVTKKGRYIMKKKFRVFAKYEVYCSVDIEADSKEEAEEIAYNMDGGDFEQTREDAFDDGNWDIVEDLTEEI